MRPILAIQSRATIQRQAGSIGVSLGAMLLVVAVSGCAGGPSQLMPTPNVYASGERDPFPDVPPEFQNNRVDVLYLTDRALDSGDAQNPTYGYKRSRSVAVGVAQVQIGKDVSWDELVKASRSAERSVDLSVSVIKTTELVRFPPTPKVLTELPEGSGPPPPPRTRPRPSRSQQLPPQRTRRQPRPQPPLTCARKSAKTCAWPWPNSPRDWRGLR